MPDRFDAPRPEQPRNVEPERLQKVLAHAGVGSRRACEELILQGRVTVNNQTVRELGTKVHPFRDAVAVDGQKIRVERPVYFAVYKPKGYVSTNNDPSGRPRVVDLLPEIPERVYTVGRLDEQSMGLILLTNDGELANKLAHPRFGVEKLYRVVVAGNPTIDVLKQLTDGIWLAEGKVRAKRAWIVGRRGMSTTLDMVLAEGKNREVRRMLAKLGHKVMSLIRVAVGPVTIKGLTTGQFRPLTGREVDLLQKVADGVPVPMPWASRPDRAPERTGRRGPERTRPPQGAPGRPPMVAGHGPRPGAGRPPGRPGYVAGPRPGGARPVGGPPPRGPRRPQGPGGPRRTREDFEDLDSGPRPVRPGGLPPLPNLPPPSQRRPAPAGGPGGPKPRPGGPGRNQGPRPAGPGIGQDHGHGPRPGGPQRGPGPRPSGPARRPGAPGGGRPPQPEPMTRRIVGMEPEPGPGPGIGGRRPMPRRPPKPLPKPRRRPPGGPGGEPVGD